jgi:hypothetical protein
MLLLHISDLHLRRGEVGTAMDPNFHLRNELVRDAEDMCARLGAPSAVLISGDLAYGGHPDEYAFGLTWLEELCRRCGTTLSAVFICPGNHDVVRDRSSRQLVQSVHKDIKSSAAISLDAKLRGLLTDPEIAPILYDSIDPYNLFAVQFFCDLRPPERTIATRDLIFADDGSTLRLSGLNSTFVSSTADKRDDLFIDPACFQLTRERGVEHLVMCHHPYNWLRQGEILRDHLNDVARLHLFGHEHTSRIEVARDWVRIAASAAHPDRVEPGWEPGYNLIELNIEGTENDRSLKVRVHVRIWQARPGQFRPKLDRGADTFDQTIKLDGWVSPSNPVSITSDMPATPAEASLGEPARSRVMDSVLDVSVQFFKLTLSQKSAIAGKLSLFEEEDLNQPDFEKFRRVLLRARERGLLDDLSREVKAATASSST